MARTRNWTQTIMHLVAPSTPVLGATSERLPALIAMACLGMPPADAWSHAYTWQKGALAQGGDVFQNEMTLDQAKSSCNGFPECCGVTFESSDKAPTGPLKMYLKSDCNVNGDAKWNTYIRGQELTEPWAYAVLGVCGFIGLYIGLGAIHGWLVRGRRGIDACPNRDELLAVWGLVQDGASLATGGMLGTNQSYGRIPEHTRSSSGSKKSRKHKSSSRR